MAVCCWNTEREGRKGVEAGSQELGSWLLGQSESPIMFPRRPFAPTCKFFETKKIEKLLFCILATSR